jgi:EAL domain-containing protein (putative c-di-GMP-specific phosphodiesterase class I)
VNVSAVQFASGDVLARILEVLHDTGLPVDRLKLKLTETAISKGRSAAEQAAR